MAAEWQRSIVLSDCYTETSLKTPFPVIEMKRELANKTESNNYYKGCQESPRANESHRILTRVVESEQRWTRFIKNVESLLMKINENYLDNFQ